MFVNVLVTAVGGIVGEGIVKSLKLANMSNSTPIKYRIYGADMNERAAGLYRCDCGILVPPASDPGYIASIKKIIAEEDIRAIYIGSDIELVPLTQAKPDIESTSEAVVITNPENVIQTARDKWKTFQFLKKNHLPMAMSCLPDEKEEFVRDFKFPLVVKPREGYASLHFYIVHSLEEMDYALHAIEKHGWNPIIQEYLNGREQEFTSGVTIDKTGSYVMSSISLRKLPKSGQTYKALVDSFDQIRKSAENVAIEVGARGPINVQAKFDGGQAKVFEINPRLSATTPIRAAAGVNEPDILFRNNVLNERVRVMGYEKMLCLRYWNEIYVKLDTYEELSSSGRTRTDSGSYNINYF